MNILVFSPSPTLAPPSSSPLAFPRPLMSNPCSTFLAVAFVSGTLEGSSVLRHHRAALRTSEAPSSLSIATHSLLYGAVSLPLGIIGASPGVAFFPNALKRPIKQESSISDTLQENKIDVSSKTEDASKNSELTEAQIHSSRAGTGRGIGRFLRDKNLKKTYSISQQQELARPAAEHLTSSGLHCQTKLRFISTLDGHALPTPLSEAMRRSRFLFVGAALISFGIRKSVSNNETANESDEDWADSIIGKHGRAQSNPGYEFERRLRIDTELANPNKWVLNNIHRQIHSSIEKVQTLALSTVCSAIKSTQQTHGGSFIHPMFNWLFQWNDLVAASKEEDNNPRPIAIRLVLSDIQSIPSPKEKEANTEQKHPFHVLPIYFNQYKSPYLWWHIDSEKKSLADLPVSSTWLVNNQQQDVINRAIIVEVNDSPSVYHALQSLNSKSSFTIGSSLRMLLNPLYTKCPDGTTSITVLIHDKEQSAQLTSTTKDQLISIDSLDVIKWAVLSTINNIYHLTAHNKDTVSASTQINKRLTEYSTDKDDATPWTVVDVIGTSIRHLLESTYRIASAVTSLGRRKPPANSTEKRCTTKDVINIVSPSNATTSWLKNSLQSQGWKVRSITPEKASEKKIEGIVLIMGQDDFETCEIACSIIEDNPNTKVLMLLENDGFMHAMLDQAAQEKVTIVCASSVYEQAFSTARSLLANGMNATEVQAELDKIYSSKTT